MNVESQDSQENKQLKLIKEKKGEEKEKIIFFLCFAAEVWKQIWLKCRIYSYYKRVDIDNGLLLKSFKFNLFSPVGAFSVLQPYLLKALQQGFLMPQECNKEAERTIMLFSRIYEILKFSNFSPFPSFRKLREFFLEQCLSSFEISYFSFIFLDLKNIEGFDKHEKLNNLCNLMDAWDINIELIDVSIYNSSSSFTSLFIYHMFLPFISDQNEKQDMLGKKVGFI